MADQRQRVRMAFDLDPVYMRAIRARAGYDGVSPSDVVEAAIDQYLPKELTEARARMAELGEESPQKTAKKKNRT